MLYEVSNAIGKGLARILYGWRVEGPLHLVPDGPFVLAANHMGVIDPWLVAGITSRRVAFMAKEELFRIPLVGGWIRAVGSFPVRRGESDREAIRTALSILGAGGIVGIFVEGTRNPEGRPLPVQHGAAMLAVRANVPLVPVAMVREGRRRITRMAEPIYPPADFSGPRRVLYDRLSDQLGEAIASLKETQTFQTAVSPQSRSIAD